MQIFLLHILSIDPNLLIIGANSNVIRHKEFHFLLFLGWSGGTFQIFILNTFSLFLSLIFLFGMVWVFDRNISKFYSAQTKCGSFWFGSVQYHDLVLFWFCLVCSNEHPCVFVS